MDFTREPVIESVVTPKEGCKLIVRSSKGVGAEEFSVDAVELVTFGRGLFLRFRGQPKPFLFPAGDYEIFEAREARMVLKTPERPKAEVTKSKEKEKPEKAEKKRRKSPKKKKASEKTSEEKSEVKTKSSKVKKESSKSKSSLLPPPPTLISESFKKSDQASEESDVSKPVAVQEEAKADLVEEVVVDASNDQGDVKS